jgi:DNA polymerase zeta
LCWRCSVGFIERLLSLPLTAFAALSREEYKPDPEVDSIAAIFYVFHDDDAPLDQLSSKQSVKEGALLLDCPQFASAKLPGVDIELLIDELDMINRLMDLVQELDPDVLAGWQVQTASWGYLRGRCRYYGQYSGCFYRLN